MRGFLIVAATKFRRHGIATLTMQGHQGAYAWRAKAPHDRSNESSLSTAVRIFDENISAVEVAGEGRSPPGWAATIILSGITTVILAGGEESKAA